MTMTYSSAEIIDRWMDKDFLFWVNRDKREEFLLEDNGKRMEKQYLGACLDYARVGAMNACFWKVGEGGVKGLIGFIDEWMKLNRDNLIWSDQPLPKKLGLPYIDHKTCPRDKENKGELMHKGTLIDGAGRKRCAHISKKEIKPSYIIKYESFDCHAMIDRINMYEEEPSEPCFNDEDYEKNGNLNIYGQERLDEYNEEMAKFESEKPVVITDPCYSIISEPRGTVMSLEKILGRLNIHSSEEIYNCKDQTNCDVKDDGSGCFGHQKPNTWAGYPFEGWELAWYVQKWHEQVPNGLAPVFNRPGEIDKFRKWPDFQVISSED